MQERCSRETSGGGSIVREERELEMTDLSSNTKNEASRPSNRQRLAMGLAAGLTTMALVVPTAIARPAGPAFAHRSHELSSISTGPTASSSGDLGDAAIGVGAVLAITALAGVGIHSRRHVPVSAASATSTS
jgi:hypothetical protein